LKKKKKRKIASLYDSASQPRVRHQDITEEKIRQDNLDFLAGAGDLIRFIDLLYISKTDDDEKRDESNGRGNILKKRIPVSGRGQGGVSSW
jgi:hypothetical protein